MHNNDIETEPKYPEKPYSFIKQQPRLYSTLMYKRLLHGSLAMLPHILSLRECSIFLRIFQLQC